MGYARVDGETTEQYVDRIRQEAANNTISSGPGGSMVQSAIDQARGFASGSGGKAGSANPAVSSSFFANPSAALTPATGHPFGTPTFAPNASTTTPTGANPVAETGVPSTTAPAGSGLAQNLIDPARRGILYNLSDPEFALQNALADRGISTYNPLIARGVMPAAKGLASAFTLQGANDASAGPGYDVASHFKDFLSNVLGGGAQGGIQGVVGNAMNTLRSPELSGKLSSAASLSQTGATPENPFIAGLLGMLQDPAQFAGIEGSLAQPLLGNGLSQALAQLQQLNVARSYRNANGTAPDAFLNYLMGR